MADKVFGSDSRETDPSNRGVRATRSQQAAADRESSREQARRDRQTTDDVS